MTRYIATVPEECHTYASIGRAVCDNEEEATNYNLSSFIAFIGCVVACLCGGYVGTQVDSWLPPPHCHIQPCLHLYMYDILRELLQYLLI